MALSASRLETLIERHHAVIRQLATLYAEMDRGYTATAAPYAFVCRGCEDNCCLTRFHHHTLVEAAGLYKGFRALSEEQRCNVVGRAQAYCEALRADAPHTPAFRHLCPLNQDGRCLLYAQRPMICRLHGIRHTLRHPRQGLTTGAGCHVFEASCRGSEGPRLDRTPLYAAMAGLEKALRQASGWEQPLRLTVAEMIVGFAAPVYPTGLESGGGGKHRT